MKKRKTGKIIGIVIASLLLLVVVGGVMSGVTPLAMNMHSSVYESDGVALEGYDVVSYFDGKPVKGTSANSYEWEGVTWYFSNAENMEKFKASPESYAPQFGGYCAFAVSTGFAAPTDPSVWAVRDNRLYIFSDEDVKEKFMEDPDAMISSCASKWNK